VIVKLAEFEVPPPGACTVTVAEPVAVIRLEGTAALNCDDETNVVLIAEPFHCTLSPLTKFVPFTVSVNPAPPATAVPGEMPDMDGTAVVIVKLAEFEAPPPGACTVTVAVPETVIRLAGTAALNCVADTNVVLSAEPFHCTLSPLTKFVPLTVSVNPAPPATAVPGDRPVIDGTAAAIVKLAEFDVPPPGACTVTVAEPVAVIRLEGTAALNCDDETNVVLNAEPFH
jgi:hypothetical protein